MVYKGLSGDGSREQVGGENEDVMQQPVAPAEGAIHRKPVHSSAPIVSPNGAGAESAANGGSDESTVEKPLPAVLPIDNKDKAEQAPSLESGSIAPYSTSTKPTLNQRFDKVFPPYKTYLGRFSRRTFLLILLALLFLIILIIGLGAGLGGKKSSKVDNKPLPPGQAQTGELTYYDPGGPGYGSCGEIHYADDAICAVSHLVYDSVAKSKNPNENVLCGRMIRVSRIDERDGKRKSVDCKVVDRCEGCKAEDVDLSPGMYNKIAAEDLGRVRGEWAWLD